MSPLAPFLAPERDDALRLGRPKEASVTYYTIPGVTATNTSTIGLTTGFDAYAPFSLGTPIVIDQAALEVTTLVNPSTVRTGIYRADKHWQPTGAPLMESGTIDSSTTGIKTYTPGTPLFLPRGRYLAVHAQSSSTVQVRTLVGSPPVASFIPSLSGSPFMTQLRASRAYAAFATPGTAWDDSNVGNGNTGFIYRAVYRVLGAMTTYQTNVEHYGPSGLIDTDVITQELTGEDEQRHLSPDRIRQAYTTLRDWSNDAEQVHTDWPTMTQGQKDAALRETIQRLGLFFDRFADLLLLEGRS